MAWNPSPEVAAARDYGKKFKADRVIILHVLEDGRYGYVSYGKTPALCAKTRDLAEKVMTDYERHLFAELGINRSTNAGSER